MPASGMWRCEAFNVIRTFIQVRLFGCGGLIHAAVGLAGGVGGFLTKRSGFHRNA
jgi:hypothetical protein